MQTQSTMELAEALKEEYVDETKQTANDVITYFKYSFPEYSGAAPLVKVFPYLDGSSVLSDAWPIK